MISIGEFAVSKYLLNLKKRQQVNQLIIHTRHLYLQKNMELYFVAVSQSTVSLNVRGLCPSCLYLMFMNRGAMICKKVYCDIYGKHSDSIILLE